MPDVEVPCVQCKEVFIFTEKEQEIFYQRNMMPPQRCLKCRSKKASIGGNAPTKFEIVCDHCGKQPGAVSAKSRPRRTVPRMFSGE